MVKSAYIHIPFCKKICSYCDFCKFIYNKSWISNYLESLENEININYKKEVLDTIYIGGGTPSSLDINELNRLFEIVSILKKSDNYEFTIEFNVEDITEKKLLLCKKYGVNRISIGVESFLKNELDFLGRNNDNTIDKIKLAKKYFDNINIDLIYALPNQTLEDLEKNLDILLELDVSHISCYSLIIEEHTLLNNMKIKNIDEDLDFEMYMLINKKLNKYNHYEISNYAKEGYESKHNLTYWNNEEYYGFGASASSYLGNIRRTNSKNILNYMNKIYKYEEEVLTKKDKISLELILGFRKIKGININEFKEKYNEEIIDQYNIKELLDEGKLEIKDDYIFISSKYIYVENEILINFI